MTAADVATLRGLSNENPDETEYEDDELQAFIDLKAGNLNRAAAHVWRLKAAKYADLVDITEGNSRRSWSKAYQQALDMAAVYERQATDDETPALGRPTARTHKITRS